MSEKKTDAEYKMLSIEQLRESKRNTRRFVDKDKLEELTASIRQKGVLTPLLARPKDGHFEIAAGSRRLKAAKAAGVKELPVLVREMSDKDFLEVITIENLQREDVHPLDEAEGYKELFKHGLKVEDLAERVGKSISYIWKRVKLTEMIPAAKKMYLKADIQLGHAIQLARQTPEHQEELVKEIKEHMRYNEWTPRDLRRSIEHRYHLELKGAAFSRTDPELVPEAGTCTECAKRSGYTPALFDDIDDKDTCTDKNCYHRKLQAHIERWIQKQIEKGHPEPLRLTTNYQAGKGEHKGALGQDKWRKLDRKADYCEHVQRGIVVEGYGDSVGKVWTVCAEPSCKEHHGRMFGGTDGSYKRQQRAEAERKKLEGQIREAILEEVLEQTSTVSGKIPLEDLRFLTSAFLNRTWHENTVRIAKRRGIEPVKKTYGKDYTTPLAKLAEDMDAADVYRFLIELSLATEVYDPNRTKDDRKALITMAERRGVDHSAIEKRIREEHKAKKAKADKKKGKAKAKKK